MCKIVKIYLPTKEVMITVTTPIIYGFENILFEKPEKRLSIVDCWTLLVSYWLSLCTPVLEKSNSFKELDVTTGICNKKKYLNYKINYVFTNIIYIQMPLQTFIFWYVKFEVTRIWRSKCFPFQKSLFTLNVYTFSFSFELDNIGSTNESLLDVT